MASKETYTYQKPSTIATRSIISGQKPAETVSTSSYDNEAHDRPNLQRKTTDHYQQAVAAATTAAPPAEKSTAPASVDSVPAKPILDRQQSWKHSDTKRAAMEKIIGETPVTQGYTTTSK